MSTAFVRSKPRVRRGLLVPVLLASACLLDLASAGEPPAAPAGAADTVFTGGDILTMRGSSPEYVEALAVKDGVIVYAGDATGVGPLVGEGTAKVDLGGKTLLPGFIDAHSHFINSLAVAAQANVYPPPFGPGKDVEGIVGALKELQTSQRIPKGEIIQAYGYDDSAVARPLTAADLDIDFPDNPVLVGHVSMHGAVLNSAAFRKFGISAATKTPPGGVIVRKQGSEEPEGLLMESAYLPIHGQLPKPAEGALLDALDRGQGIYAAVGVTTAHEGSSQLADVRILQKGAAAGRLRIDVVAYPFITDLDAVLKETPVSKFGVYDHRLKLGGAKITMDGSPQGRTAFFTTPYLTGGPGGEKDWRGEPTFPIPMLRTMVKHVIDLGLDLIVHCNGDAAVDEFLKAYELALGAKVTEDRRTGIIHSQFVRKDQLAKYKAYRLIPSFYTEHTYFFGTTHTRQRGAEQAAFLSPMRTAIDLGIRCANHTDFVVAPIDQLFTVWTAVNRVSREGRVIGAGERITPYEALQAITSVPAYWYREEGRKGTLAPGLLADLVILDRNPLKVPPMEIKDIRVVSTLKEGKAIYEAKSSK